MPTDSNPKAFKHWFDRAAAQTLAAQMAKAWPAFDQKRFIRTATENLDQLELADRVKRFAAALRETLPADIPRALRVLTKSLPPALANCEAVSGGVVQWPLGQFIADYGTDHFDESFVAMTELTKRLTSEFAVRPFVELYPEKTFARMLALASDPNPHVRRWCSEGTRPRLPWGKKLHALVADPTPIFPILETLKDDPELYVRKSVANNLNDIAKDHPERVVALCRKWTKGAAPGRLWIINRALRSLIKDGHAGALAVVGVKAAAGVTATLSAAPKKVKIGSAATLSATIRNASKKPQKIVVDYVLGYAKASGKTAAKVFKWKSFDLPAGETIELQKSQPMKNVSIRKLYPGTHTLALQINGSILAETAFELVE